MFKKFKLNLNCKLDWFIFAKIKLNPRGNGNEVVHMLNNIARTLGIEIKLISAKIKLD